MKLLLIRHGETISNVEGVYAGVTDSSLTNHGVVQAKKLGHYFHTIGTRIDMIFSSDLQRAYLTAESIREYQSSNIPPTIRLPSLREQDFGSFEGKKYSKRIHDSNSPNSDLKNSKINRPESKRSMQARADSFIDSHLAPVSKKESEKFTIAVISHGIFLGQFWSALVKRFNRDDIHFGLGTELSSKGFTLDYLGGWSNTGYLELDIIKTPTDIIENRPGTYDSSSELKQPIFKLSASDSHSTPHINRSCSPKLDEKPANSQKFLHFFMTIKAINNQEHLTGLKKSRGGMGNIKFDASQRTIEYFFASNKKKP